MYISSAAFLGWEEVGHIYLLYHYPLKSGRGNRVPEFSCTELGPEYRGLHDRCFLVITEDGRMVTGRQTGKLMTINTKYNNDNTVTLSSTLLNESSVTFDLREVIETYDAILVKLWWQEEYGLDCGDKVAKWLSDFLYDDGTKVRLVCQGDLDITRPARKPNYFDFTQFKENDKLVYADTTPYNVASETSLEDLNRRLTAKNQSVHDTFRANFWVKGSVPYDEDDWAFIRIGDEVILRTMKPCERCILTTVDPLTGERNLDSEPLRTLRKYRIIDGPPKLAKSWSMKPVFGRHMGLLKGGRVRVGDKVFVSRMAQNPKYKLWK
ncbi:mitochondrial amidoxime-reducing component 1-like isoform X2 [Oratosquilla oratoria]|uniref:mitochondrial amidoxime-reducing component 1-like isoform X2 n=1 Tax=Oratosquilla oratoria TaxID=337810 RepID=UPI003F7779C2